MEEQPRAMLKTSINNSISVVRRIQSGLSEDQTTLKELLSQLHSLQIIPSAVTSLSRLDSSADPAQGANREFPERLRTSESEIVSTACDEENKGVNLLSYRIEGRIRCFAA